MRRLSLVVALTLATSAEIVEATQCSPFEPISAFEAARVVFLGEVIDSQWTAEGMATLLSKFLQTLKEPRTIRCEFLFPSHAIEQGRPYPESLDRFSDLAQPTGRSFALANQKSAVAGGLRPGLSGRSSSAPTPDF